MERNWLIRTTQNQILGPVAKAKLLEFVQKGALGLNDEVTSGNGYWFSLKEKDLVEKYLYGDIPQGYNPISESKSVLSKRENPDKTTSLNTAPANKTQVVKPGTELPGVLPKSDDLEYPDITLVNTVATTSAPSVSNTTGLEDMKLPNQEDLEFPDIAMVAASVNNSMNAVQSGLQGHIEQARPIEIKSRPQSNETAPVDEGSIIYPEDDDLAYPDMGSRTSAAAEPQEEERDFKVAIPGSVEAEPKREPQKGSRDFKNEFEDDSGLTLVMSITPKDLKEVKEVKEEVKPEPKLSLAKKERPKESAQASTHTQHEDKKLLHERKVKASSHKETTRDLPKDLPPRAMPEELKKRNDNYLMYILVILVLIILGLFFYYYRTILNKPLPV